MIFSPAVILVIILFLVNLAVDRLSLDAQTAWSFKIGIWGLLVSIVGFTFTLWQLYRTQSVTVATQAAIGKIKRDFQSLDVIVELSNARNEARSTLEKLIGSEWARCATGYSSCRTSLDKCLAATTDMYDAEKSELRDFQAKFIFAEKLMNSKSMDNNQEVDSETLADDLTEFSSFVNNLEYSIRSRFGGK